MALTPVPKAKLSRRTEGMDGGVAAPEQHRKGVLLCLPLPPSLCLPSVCPFIITDWIHETDWPSPIGQRGLIGHRHYYLQMGSSGIIKGE